MIYLLLLIADLYLFFILYVASIGMIRAHFEKKITGILWGLCVPFVALSWLFDVLHNVILFSIIFVEYPKQLTVTKRLKRHIDKAGYRGWLARYICKSILSPFDHTGDHCD